MGRVVLALDSRLRRQVAVKVPRGKEARARLAREAFITAQLEHPGIVTVYDAGTNALGEPFYTMRLVRGRSLEEQLVAEKDPASTPLRALLAACEAVGFAHRAGVVHRDLKPANIMVGDFGEVVVVDWGLALTVSELAQHRGEVAGTPGYMSPEQLQGATLDARSDVWGLGAILYRILSGHPPGAGTTRPEAAVHLMPIRPLSEVSPETPRELVAIAEHALALDPEHRYPDALTLARDLENWLLGRRVSAYEYSSLELLKRLVRAWRVPLVVALVALAVLAVLAIVATDRVVTERDRAVHAEFELGQALDAADMNLGRALMGLAERHRDSNEPAEAELAAAAALAKLGGSDLSALGLEALGMMAHFDVPRPRLIGTTPLSACARWVISPTGATALCVDSGRLIRVADQHPLGSFPTPILEAALTSTHLQLSHRLGQVTTYDLASGLPLGPALPCESHPRLVVAGETSWRLWGFVAGQQDSPHVLLACPADHAVEAVAELAHHVVSLCNDGVMRLIDTSFVGGAVVAELDVVAQGRAMVTHGHDLWFATEPGQLHRILATDGGLEQVWTLETGITSVRSLALSPDGRLLAVGAEGRGVTLLAAEDGRFLARLPAHAGPVARFDGNDSVLAFSNGLTASARRFSVPAVSIAARIGVVGSVGLSTFAVTEDYEGKRFFVTGDGAGQVAVFDESARVRARRDFGGGVIKRLEAHGDTIWLCRIGGFGAMVLDLDLVLRGHVGGPATQFRRLLRLSSGELLGAEYTRAAGRLTDDGFVPIGDLVALDLAASPARDAAVLVGVDGRVAVYRGGPLAELGRIAGARAAAIDPVGVVVITADAVRWLAPDGVELQHEATAVDILDVALGEGFVALARADGRTVIRAREPGSRPLVVLSGHAERVAQVEVWGDVVYTASWDGTLMRHRLQPFDAGSALLWASARWGLGLKDLLQR